MNLDRSSRVEDGPAIVRGVRGEEGQDTSHCGPGHGVQVPACGNQCKRAVERRLTMLRRVCRRLRCVDTGMDLVARRRQHSALEQRLDLLGRRRLRLRLQPVIRASAPPASARSLRRARPAAPEPRDRGHRLEQALHQRIARALAAGERVEPLGPAASRTARAGARSGRGSRRDRRRSRAALHAAVTSSSSEGARLRSSPVRAMVA